MLIVASLGMGCLPTYSQRPALEPAGLSAPRPYRWVEVDGIDTAYLDTGGAGPVVLLVHGLSSHAAFWQHQVDALAEDHRVLAVDLPGFGASDRPDAPYTPPWYAEHLVSFLDVLQIERVHYVGHSMGGQIGLTLALEHEERLSSLILAAPAGIETFRPGHAAWMSEYWTEARTLYSAEVDVRRSFGMVFAQPDEHAEQLLAERVQLGQHEAFRGTSVAVSRCVSGMLEHPVHERLPEISVPTLIVFGRRDALIPNPIFNGGRTAAVAHEGQSRIPGAELVLIRGAGHAVQHDAPDLFNQAAQDFLSRLCS